MMSIRSQKPVLRRSQASIEYLMTHGWAIMVVMAVGGLFIYLESVTPSNQIKSVGFVYFALLDSLSLSQDGATVLTFRNMNPNGITINTSQTYIKNLNTGRVCNYQGYSFLYPVSYPYVVGPQNVAADGVFRISTLCVTPSESDFELEVSIVYDVFIGGQLVQKGETGTIRGTHTISNPTSPYTCYAPLFNDLYHRGMVYNTNLFPTTSWDKCATINNLPAFEGPKLQKVGCLPVPFNMTGYGGSGSRTLVCKCVDGACVKP